MPRVLARVPYGAATNAIEEFAFEEAPKDAKGNEKPLEHEEYCWMNAAYVLGARLTDAFAKNGWCTAIRGAENGGKVEGLPSHVFKSDDGDTDQKCPTEIGIDERREYELFEEFRFRGIHRQPDGQEADQVQHSRRDRKRADRIEAAVCHGDRALCAFSEGHGPRQDRFLHGSG
jgi:type VI secretion system ImpC/EvpB family protein